MKPAVIDLSPGFHRNGLGYHLMRSGRALWGILRICGAALLASRQRYIMNLDGDFGLVYNILLAMAIRITGQKAAFYHHSSRYVLADSKLIRVLLAVDGKVPQIFCSPEMGRQYFDRYNRQGQALVINNAAWISAALIPPAEDDSATLRLGFLSTLSLEKGLGRALDTLRALRRHGVFAQLELAGAVSDSQTEALIAEAARELGPQLVMHGVLQGAAKTQFMSRLDYFLFPSLYVHETQSLVVPEALAAGVPVIAFDHRFVGEAVGDGGLVISPGDDFALCAAGWIIAGSGRRDERRRNARAQFEAQRAEAQSQIETLIDWSVGDLPSIGISLQSSR